MNSGHYILPAMPKGSTRTSLGPKNIPAYIYHDVCSSLHPNVQPDPPVQADPPVKHVNPTRPTASSSFPLHDLQLIWIKLTGNQLGIDSNLLWTGLVGSYRKRTSLYAQCSALGLDYRIFTRFLVWDGLYRNPCVCISVSVYLCIYLFSLFRIVNPFSNEAIDIARGGGSK